MRTCSVDSLNLSPNDLANLLKVSPARVRNWASGMSEPPYYVGMLAWLIGEKQESVAALCDMPKAARYMPFGGDLDLSYSEGATRWRAALADFNMSHRSASRYFGVSVPTVKDWAADNTAVPHGLLLLCYLMKKHSVPIHERYQREKPVPLTQDEREFSDKKEIEFLKLMLERDLAKKKDKT